MKLPIIPPQAKLIALGLLLATIAGLAWYVKDTIDENAKLKAEMKTALDRITKAEDANARQDETFLKRDELHTILRNGVADVTVRIQQEKTRDPETAAVLGTRLPDGLRRAILHPTGPAAQREGAAGGNEDRGQAPIQP